MDETTLSAGCFFATGPDFSMFTGPDMQIFQEYKPHGSGSDDILESPALDGFLQGTITFQKVSLVNPSVVITGVYDTIGSGYLWGTKAILTPTEALQPNTVYQVYLTGTDHDTTGLITGISARTVFDTVASGHNTGTGTVKFDGGYIGSWSDVYHATITSAGELGTAKFTFYRDSDPTSVYGPFKTKESPTLLSDCVNITFSDATYQIGDSWLALVVPKTIFDGNIQYPFQTGSGSIVTLPDSTSTTILGDIPAPASLTVATFGVASTYPINNVSNLTIPSAPFTMTATFNEPILAASVHSGVNITVYLEDVEGAPPNPVPPQIIVSDPTVSGNTLSITVNSGVLTGNRVVTVTVDAGVQSTTGHILASSYSWSFTTTYDPMYTTMRRMRLIIGNYLPNVADETINYAIYLASLMADELTWNKENLTDPYYQFVRQQWTQCKAEEFLLMNLMGGPSRIAGKELGDLKVEYYNPSLIPVLDRALQCQQQWMRALLAGGRMIQKAAMVVKGSSDPDSPPLGRGWYHQRNLYSTQSPVANQRTRYAGQRRFRSNYSFAWWNAPGWWSNR